MLIRMRTTTGGVGESSLTTVNGFRLVEPFGGLFRSLRGGQLTSRTTTYILSNFSVTGYTKSFRNVAQMREAIQESGCQSPMALSSWQTSTGDSIRSESEM